MNWPTHDRYSPAELLSLLPASERQAILGQLSDDQAAGLLYDWTFWARPKQLAPSGDWRVWLLNAGRGFGKTRCGAEWVRSLAEAGAHRRIALIGPTAADVRDVMVEGESGILAVSPPWFRPEYKPSKRRLIWPNGVIATTYSADRPDRLRGPQHHAAWADELAAWRYPVEAWDMLQFGLRLGTTPQACVTTTPRPIPIIQDLVAASDTAVTSGSTFENKGNLAPAFLARMIAKYAGTRLGRQELYAEILSDTPGALWTRSNIEVHRVTSHPPLVRIVVGVDPEASSSEGAAETGIIAVALGTDGHAYVFDDVSIRGTPLEWAGAAVALYHKLKADRLIGEQNNGGEMVESTVRTVDKTISYKGVYASRGKQIRAEPVAALYEQGKVHHLGYFGPLEDQLCTWVQGMKSPDRLDALVWAITELMLGAGASGAEILDYYRQRAEAERAAREAQQETNA